MNATGDDAVNANATGGTLPGGVYAAELLAVIAAPTVAAKAALLAPLAPPGSAWALPGIPARPGRPPAWRESAEAPRRRKALADLGGRTRFLHALHHIEMSAIDLAVLLCLRAAGAPAELHADFLGIAREEAIHAGLIEAWLDAHGCPPGTHPVHHKLWDAARAADSLGEQLVVVPRFLEARGLDVSIDVLPRLEAIDPTAGAIVARIYRDELRHVAIGTQWHRWWCAAHGWASDAHFAHVVRAHFANQLPSPFALDHPGRMQAGFSAAEIALLEARPDEAPGAEDGGPGMRVMDRGPWRR